MKTKKTKEKWQHARWRHKLLSDNEEYYYK